MNLHPRGRARPARRFIALAIPLAVFATALSSCGIPNAPPYPYWGPFASRQGVIDKAQDMSNKLEQYVKDYLDGKVPAQIPASLLPDAKSKDLATWTVQRESEIDANTQWIKRTAVDSINVNAVRGNAYPEPHATYLLMPQFVPPFGTKVHINGKFPHSRFFDIQATPSFQPEQYAYQAYGVGEVPIVDADINPQAGSTNPFRPGANRNAANRDYEVIFNSMIGNSALIDPAYKPPFRSQTNNTRTTSGLSYRGPWGDPNYPETNTLIDKAGFFTPNELWVRYYAPDKNVDKFGGVPVPKVVYELPDHRRYFIQVDLAQFDANINKLGAIHSTAPVDPGATAGKDVGWYKMWGISSGGLANAVRDSGLEWLVGKDKVRAIAKGSSGIGDDLPPPQNYEQSKTLCYYCHYFNRSMSLGTGKVIALTGRLPTVPKTRSGEATMTGGQARYFSITTYDGTLESNCGTTCSPFAMPITSIMDDEIVTDANGYYTIVYSRPEDRPANATAANGVTWVNWGPLASSGFMLRWLDVGPEWTFAKAPNEVNLGRGSDYASAQWNPALTGKNDHTGFLAEYQPRLSYLDKGTFLNIGGGWITEARVPAWT